MGYPFPTKSQDVSVLREALFATSYDCQPGLSRDDYIAMNGRLTRRTDKKLTYVVRANHAVVTGNRSKCLGRRGNTEIRLGETIVAPLETDKIRPVTFWTNVTQILYQAAIAVAAVQMFNA